MNYATTKDLESFFKDDSNNVAMTSMFSHNMFSELILLLCENGMENLEGLISSWNQEIQSLTTFQYASDICKNYDEALSFLGNKRIALQREAMLIPLQHHLIPSAYWDRWKIMMFKTSVPLLSNGTAGTCDQQYYQNLFKALVEVDISRFPTKCIAKQVLFMAVTDVFVAHIARSSETNGMKLVSDGGMFLEDLLLNPIQERNDQKEPNFLRTPSRYAAIENSLAEANTWPVGLESLHAPQATAVTARRPRWRAMESFFSTSSPSWKSTSFSRRRYPHARTFTDRLHPI